jgi:hypothetical protein
MATHRSGHRAGGGIASKVNVKIPVRTGSGSRAIREPAVAQIGGNYGNHTTNQGSTGWRPGSIYGGRGMNPVPYGNAKALDVGGGGPGTGRTVMHCGSQSTHGPTNPGSPRPVPSGHIISSYGPDYKTPRR